MKKFPLLLGLFLVLPVSAFSAYDDVSLTTDTRIGLTGETLNVSGSTAIIQSLTVNADSFVVTLVPGGNSSIKVSSPSLYRITHSVTPQSAYVDAEVCNGSESSVTLAPLSGQTIQVTVQVDTSSSLCSGGGGSSGGSSGGGGGGGGGGLPPPPPPTEVTPPPAPPPPAPASAPTVFTKVLSLGTVSLDVKKLQQLLNQDSDTKIALSGIGSPGQETTYFGALTKKAVGKFQLKYKLILSDKDPGYGLVGPKTRAKLNEIGKGGVGAAPSTTTGSANQATVQSIQAKIAALLEQIKKLQGQ